MSARSLRQQTLPRFALRRDEAAASLSVSPSTFDNWVAEGKMPAGLKIGAIMLWDVQAIHDHWQALREAPLAHNPLDGRVL
ncbi:hypothetical protein AncyloWKF20_08640 [Ancylobacter sp. WKF20]|uniref:helix-turn-helix transcriptional regulator n=1 Tax=Ancylobacter sp. WKF20 TaxID=3039801 RepID=UPI00243448F1|nr:hypothetical protein [Ancylobacter sp. WKF20]WGD31870.1 hypothetical protein AncyloWKF20_08640 [Ancylobacter sp. WKF20]